MTCQVHWPAFLVPFARVLLSLLPRLSVAFTALFRRFYCALSSLLPRFSIAFTALFRRFYCEIAKTHVEVNVCAFAFHEKRKQIERFALKSDFRRFHFSLKASEAKATGFLLLVNEPQFASLSEATSWHRYFNTNPAVPSALRVVKWLSRFSLTALQSDSRRFHRFGGPTYATVPQSLPK